MNPTMDDPESGYEQLSRRLRDVGHDLDAVEAAMADLEIEVPSWAFGDSGTRFATFQQPGRPRDVFEKVDDAGQVRRLTGSARSVALHFPWDHVDDLADLGRHAHGQGLQIGAVNPNLFQDPDYKLGSITNPERRVRAKAVEHVIECSRIASELGSSALSLWFADGTNYPGQDDLADRRRRLIASLRDVYDALPVDQELLLEYKLFEPAFYATDLGDWGSAVLVCQKLGARARVLVDLGHHAHGTNVEQIVALLGEENRLGGFHFNNRKYADDDLIVGSVNPLELFLIFCELTSDRRPLPRLTIDQAHNVEPKVEAVVLSVMNLQEAHARSLLVDRAALDEAQKSGDVLGGYERMLDAFQIDVRPLCAKVRAELGAASDPIAALRTSGYAMRTAAERGGSPAVTGG